MCFLGYEIICRNLYFVVFVAVVVVVKSVVFNDPLRHSTSNVWVYLLRGSNFPEVSLGPQTTEPAKGLTLGGFFNSMGINSGKFRSWFNPFPNLVSGISCNQVYKIKLNSAGYFIVVYPNMFRFYQSLCTYSLFPVAL